MNRNKIFGWILIVIGLIILFTPLTPGSILLLIGADMVFRDWPEWKKIREKIRQKFWKT